MKTLHTKATQQQKETQTKTLHYNRHNRKAEEGQPNTERKKINDI